MPDAGRLSLRSETFFARQRTEVLTSQRVVDIGAAMKRLRLASGAVIPYEYVSLATGARNRVLTASTVRNACPLPAHSGAIPTQSGHQLAPNPKA